MFFKRLLARALMAFPGCVLLIVSGATLITSPFGTLRFTQALCVHVLAQVLCIIALCWPVRSRHRGGQPTSSEQIASLSRRETGQRLAQFHPGTQTICLLYGSAMLGALLYFLIAGGIQTRNLFLLRTTGMTTNGTILGTNYREGKPNITVTYSFLVPGGPPIAASFHVSRARIGEMRTGNMLTITYVPIQPDRHTWQTVDNSFVLRQVVTGIALFTVVMTYLLLPVTLIERRLRIQLRLARTGQAITGTIVVCKPLLFGHRRLGYGLIYTFVLPSGDQVVARALVPSGTGDPTLPGFPITVLVDPDRPWTYRPLAALNAVAITNLRRGVLVGG